ncbi:hypothetical protein B0F90DRAFT_1734227 [Multifurca ochricompacta]|uniref:Zn(2)-C6 fungal-type domain-containing protein n=1 Tax=Multifurca ochricompacta TaxID=376703 RepID=A0AAD4M1Z7_9AGAM|nr:hypothetical protein B0F90DRAFT_1734227 [Multifurca ochricompacta]
MLRYPTPSDQRYGDAGNPAMVQGSIYWNPGGPDGSQPAVNRDSDDRHGLPRLRASQLITSSYAPATTYAVTPPRDSYTVHTQNQSDCPEQYGYPPQHYPPVVNYSLPPYDFAEYPKITSDSVQHQHCGQYLPHPPAANHYEYPPSDPAAFQHTTYDPTPSPESQPISRASIALPSLLADSPPAPKRDPSETVVGLHPVKTEYGMTTNGQLFSPMTPLNSPPLTGKHAPYLKEESQEEVHHGGLSMPRPSTPVYPHGHLHHRQRTHESFRLVQDPAAYPGFASPPKRHPPPPSLAIPGPLAYSPNTRISTPLSSSFSSSDVGTPTSTIHLQDAVTCTSSQTPSTVVPNPKAGQGVLKLPSTKRSARRKPAIACLFCRERKIACGAPPAGSADTTCNQCARRSRKCEYPTMSRRGLHKRRDNGGGGGGGHLKETEDGDYVPAT